MKWENLNDFLGFVKVVLGMRILFFGGGRKRMRGEIGLEGLGLGEEGIV